MTLGAAVFASGRGSNFEALARRPAWHRARSETPPWRVTLVVSDRAEAPVLAKAAEAGIPSIHVPVRGRDADEVAQDTLRALTDAGVDLVLLAGYLRLVPAPVIEEFRDRILNIHPALLPSFGGKGMFGHHVHEAVLRSGARLSGVTVHLVDERFDEGRILAQWPVPVLPDDDVSALAQRIQEVEHLLYPQVVDHAARAIARDEPPEPLTFATYHPDELSPP